MYEVFNCVSTREAYALRTVVHGGRQRFDDVSALPVLLRRNLRREIAQIPRDVTGLVQKDVRRQLPQDGVDLFGQVQG